MTAARPVVASSWRRCAGADPHLAEVFALHAAGRTRVIAEPRKLDDINACIDDVLAGRVPARLVFEF